MATCAHCNTEQSELYDNAVAICLACVNAQDPAQRNALHRAATANGNGHPDTTSNAPRCKRKPPTSKDRVLNVLREDLQSTKERVTAATAAFDAVTSEISSALLRPGGTQRIHSASREVTVARMAMLRAHHRLSDFLNAGIVPEDLKRSG